MLKAISQFCTRFPWIIILVVFATTVFFAQQISSNLQFEADVTKSMPTDIAAVKADDYYKKNFNYQDVMFIGIEKPDGSVMEVEVLHKIEQIVLDIKGLKAPKSFDSVLTGKKETLVQPIGIDTDNIRSVANLEDAILDKETGSVVSGSVIEKLKKDHGIPSDSGKEERLPDKPQDLKRIVPELTQRIMQDRSFRNSILSEDMHASAIMVSMLRKWDYKKRYAILELSTALDATRLKRRFKGGDSSNFPFTIYGKTLAGVQVDDAFIAKQVAETRKGLSRFLTSELGHAAKTNPMLSELLAQEMTPESFQAIMTYMEGRDFFTSDSTSVWTNFINDIWDFTLESIDPFSRENLEFQLHDVKNIFNFDEIYRMVNTILEKHQLNGVNYYVAGIPVVIGVIGSMMSSDTVTLIPIAVLVIFFVLGISFRSFRGVIIPALTVVLSVLWTVGIMAVLNISLKVGTTMLPIILLGIGTAYAIHLVNRYYEDAAIYTEKGELVRQSMNHVGVAVVMAAVTTMAGFSSLATSDLSMIREFGIFAAVGVSIALILSLTLTPSLLVLWKVPRKHKYAANDQDIREMVILRFMRKLAELVGRKPVHTSVILGLMFIVSVFLATGNKFEGSMMKNFDSENPLFKSDQFINERLTGTTNINLLFKFRDQINMKSTATQDSFKKHLSRFSTKWQDMIRTQHELDAATQIVKTLNRDADSLPGSLDSIIRRLELIQDILNEEFVIEVSIDPGSEAADSLLDSDSDSLDEGGGDDLDTLDGDEGGALGSLADDEVDDEKEAGVFVDLSEDQVLGLKDINSRLGRNAGAWESTGQLVVLLRQAKDTEAGLKMQRQLNLTTDFLAVDIKQPTVLNKLEGLHHFFYNMKDPVITIREKKYDPTGFVMTPVDLIRRFYKVFYHNDDPAYDRLPDVSKDGFKDITLTNRAINGVVLNQALSGDRDAFEGIISPNLKEFQVQINLKSGSHNIIDKYLELTLAELKRVFPDDDPYIETIRVGGAAATSNSINQILSESQLRSIILSFIFVFCVTFFIFRSVVGGLFSLIPLLFTVILNFGLIRLISGEITTATMMVASISIGTGVDYTIHFLERLKIQLRLGDDLARAYINTVMSSGRAILLNASAVALGFLVLVFSVFVPQIMMGILMAATMLFSSIGALVLLPAIILLTKPKYLTRLSPIPVKEKTIVAN